MDAIKINKLIHIMTKAINHLQEAQRELIEVRAEILDEVLNNDK